VNVVELVADKYRWKTFKYKKWHIYLLMDVVELVVLLVCVVTEVVVVAKYKFIN